MATASDPVRFSVSDGVAERFVRSLRLAAVAWLALFIVVVCAVVPAGLPLTTAQGSAFNPATTAVALQAKPPHARLLVKRLIEPDGKDTPFAVVQPPALLGTASPIIVSLARFTSAWPAIHSASFARLILDALPWARGPPAV